MAVELAVLMVYASVETKVALMANEKVERLE